MIILLSRIHAGLQAAAVPKQNSKQFIKHRLMKTGTLPERLYGCLSLEKKCRNGPNGVPAQLPISSADDNVTHNVDPQSGPQSRRPTEYRVPSLRNIAFARSDRRRNRLRNRLRRRSPRSCCAGVKHANLERRYQQPINLGLSISYSRTARAVSCIQAPCVKLAVETGK